MFKLVAPPQLLTTACLPVFTALLLKPTEPDACGSGINFPVWALEPSSPATQEPP